VFGCQVALGLVLMPSSLALEAVLVVVYFVAFMCCAYMEGAMRFGPPRWFTERWWWVSGTACMCSAAVAVVLYRSWQARATAFCAIALVAPSLWFRPGRVRPSRQVVTGRRAKPETDSWRGLRRVAVVVGLVLQVLALRVADGAG